MRYSSFLGLMSCVLAVPFLRVAMAAEEYTFSTVIGASGVGTDDGQGGAARFYEPAAISSDGNGNLYVVDAHANTLRKISASGVVTTVAGSPGTEYPRDGIGANARFGHPRGVAVGSDGSVYVADYNYGTIRRVMPGGVVLTLAGGAVGFADGVGNAARFFNPAGLAVTDAGVVYVADSMNHVIRRIDPDRVVTTVAGSPSVPGSADGTGGTARFNQPMGVAVDPVGNLYVADMANSTIRKITPAGVVTTLAGTAGASGWADGMGADARFQWPRGIAVDGHGNVYVADSNGGTLRKITPAGLVSTVAYTLSWPGGVAFDGATGHIFVADTNNRVIRKVTVSGTVTTFAGSVVSRDSADGIGTAARLGKPTGLAIDSSGTIFIADATANAIRKSTADYLVTTVAGRFTWYGTVDGVGTGAYFSTPNALVRDSSGNLFVTEHASAIRKIDAAGIVTTWAGAAESNGSTDAIGAAARFHSPSAIAADGAGNLWIADTNNHTIRKISPSGQVTTPLGKIGMAGFADDTGNSAQFSSPAGLAFDAAGTLYVSDLNNHAIRVVSPTGVVRTLAGRPAAYGNIDGPPDVATFVAPRGLAVDDQGNVYVVDSATHTVRKINSAGHVTTIGGMPDVLGFKDGTGSEARFNEPYGVVVDRYGHIYVADSKNAVIRRGIVAGAKSPVFTSHPQQSAVGAGRQASFVAAAGGPPVPSYQWERRAAGATSFVALTDGGGVSGATTATLTIAAATAAMHGDEFRCIAHNGILPAAVSNSAKLSIVLPPVFTTAGSATFTVGVAESVTLAATAATAYKIVSGDFPSWATLNVATGDIEGTAPADAIGPYIFDVQATNAAVEAATQTFTLNIGSGPVITAVSAVQKANAGYTAVLHASAAGRSPISYQWTKNGVPITNSVRISGADTSTLAVGSVVAADAGEYVLVATGPDGTQASATAALTVAMPPIISTQPASLTVDTGARATFSVTATSSTPVSFQWYFNGTAIPSATGSQYAITAASYTWAGQYAVRVSDAVTSVWSEPAILSVTAPSKVTGFASEVGPDIVHANGRVYDQVLLTGASGTFRADPDQVLRVSCIDLNDDIVQIEFSGAGTLHLRLENAAGPAVPARYNQSVQYMRGLPSITIAGADESTYLTIFTVGSITAVNQSLFREDVSYDGVADIGLVSISSRNGKFGGIFSGNVSYLGTKGLVGIYAPDVEFTAPVVIGDLSAVDDARAVLILGTATDVRVAGGNLMQLNRQPVQIKGVSKLTFTAGANSHGVARSAKNNQARLERDHEDVTGDVVVNPTP